MDQMSEKRYPVSAEEYKLYEEIGEGVSATVYRALCVPLNEIVAIKVLDLEKCNNDLDGIRREVHTMNLIGHPNLLRAYCSFTTGHSLWVVTPYMAGGSGLHIMKSSYPEGFEEPVIATLLRETLKALVYLHAHGHIHRDVKAGNILLDTNGAVKLADFGVSACMFDTGERQRSRNTFVGTPCWMAPEVMQQLHGYDFKADIWSFGITALELAHGHAPFSKYPPMKVLLMTLQNAPPGLDYERDKKFSKSFKELVATCLVKDPKKRPTAEKLLKHHFFKHARSNEFVARTVLDGLPPLGERFSLLKAREADLLGQNKALYEDKEHLSQQEYIRGISAWNFNLEDLKAQAALIQDCDEVSIAENPDVCTTEWDRGDAALSLERLTLDIASSDISIHEDILNDMPDLKSSLASFPIKPLQALKGCFDIDEDEVGGTSPSWNDSACLDSESARKLSPYQMDQESEIQEGENPAQSDPLTHPLNLEAKKLNCSLQDNASSPKKVIRDGDRDLGQSKYQSTDRNYSGALHQKRENNNLSSEDASEGAVVQHKGRFKVTSADLSPKGSTNTYFNQGGGSSNGPANVPAASLLSSLQNILQQNAIQREELIKLIKYVEQSSSKRLDSVESSTNDLLQGYPTSATERELQAQVSQLQESIERIVEQVQRQKMKNSRLETQLNALEEKAGRGGA